MRRRVAGSAGTDDTSKMTLMMPRTSATTQLASKPVGGT